MTTLLDELSWRGLVHDQTPGIAGRLAQGPITGYVGFDPTAPSLQVGNLVPLMLLMRLQRAGGRPIVVLGGGTGLIGDPSGRRTERPLLPAGQVVEHAARQRRQFERFLDFAGARGALLVDNATWLPQLNLVEFLRDIGKHFTLGYMLQKESVRGRLEAGISFTEFSYMLLQAYDFLELYRRHGCELQLGGSDQWGNITAGIELIRRVTGGDAHGISAPLITTAAGAKFGKSEGQAVWLDPALTSPYQFYQFWINADDRDVERHLKFFTFKSAGEVAALMAQQARDPGTRVAHRALAADVTALVHGAAATRSAADASSVLFDELDPARAGPDTWAMLATELPHATLPRDLTSDTPVLELVAQSTLVTSRSDARRQIAQGGITVNGRRAREGGAIGAPLVGGYYWVQRGKKSSFVFTPAS